MPTNVETYQALLQDPRWQKKRLAIFNRDDFTCQYCGKTTETLHVHHMRYFRNTAPWEIPDEQLLTLCRLCHNMEESKKALDVYDILDGSGLTRLHVEKMFFAVSEIMRERSEGLTIRDVFLKLVMRINTTNV